MCAKVISNKKQLERLVRLMEQNPNIANGLITKTHAKHEWEKIADELNSLGPPKREWQRWLRVWTDMKYKIKSKKLHNLTELNTTGGIAHKLYHLTDLEESVLNLINLKVRLFPPKTKAKPKKFVIKNDNDDDAQMMTNNEKSMCDKNKHFKIYPMIENKADIKNEINETKTNQRLPSANKKDAHYVHVKKEIKEVKKCFRKIKKYEKMEFRLKKKEFMEIIALKKEKLRLFKEDLKHKQQIREHKLDVKLQLLEIEKQKLNNQNSF